MYYHHSRYQYSPEPSDLPLPPFPNMQVQQRQWSPQGNDTMSDAKAIATLNMVSAIKAKRWAGAITQKLRTKNKNRKDFARAVRLIAENIDRQPEVLITIPIDELIQWDETMWYMGSEEAKEEEEWITQMLPKKQVVDLSTIRSILRCSKCGAHKVKYYSRQTRSADEPMTIFASCLACKYRWRQ